MKTRSLRTFGRVSCRSERVPGSATKPHHQDVHAQILRPHHTVEGPSTDESTCLERGGAASYVPANAGGAAIMAGRSNVQTRSLPTRDWGLSEDSLWRSARSVLSCCLLHEGVLDHRQPVHASILTKPFTSLCIHWSYLSTAWMHNGPTSNYYLQHANFANAPPPVELHELTTSTTPRCPRQSPASSSVCTCCRRCRRTRSRTWWSWSSGCWPCARPSSSRPS
jgi:hypothetical protein